MTMALVVSVPHTGTNTVEALLRKVGIEYVRAHTHTARSGKTPWDRQARFPHDLKVCPLRHPQPTWRSWCARGIADPDVFLYAWQMLQEFVDEFEPIVVPIDRDIERDDVLPRIHSELVYEGEHENKYGKDLWVNYRPMPLRILNGVFDLNLCQTRYSPCAEFF